MWRYARSRALLPAAMLMVASALLLSCEADLGSGSQPLDAISSTEAKSPEFSGNVTCPIGQDEWEDQCLPTCGSAMIRAENGNCVCPESKYRDGMLCKGFYQDPCMLRRNSDCTWACGNPPDASPPLVLKKASESMLATRCPTTLH